MRQLTYPRQDSAPRTRVLAAALGTVLLLAPGWSAQAADTDPAVVVNGTFSSPAVPAGQTWGGRADDWEGSTLLVSTTRAGHPRGYQATALASATATPISTRVRGVAAGATVTVTWDDSPDTCVNSGGGRPYTVSAAGSAPGDYSTNAANGQPNWYTGRSYSFTAAEDAPAVTFTFGTPAVSPGCRPNITNVQAFQTPPPAKPPAPPSKSDPCAGDGAGSPACTTSAGNKEQIDKCPATSRDCLATVAGKGEQENAGIAQQTQALDEFTNAPRDQDPNTAAAELCKVANAHTGNLQPGDTVIAPGTWWYC